MLEHVRLPNSSIQDFIEYRYRIYRIDINIIICWFCIFFTSWKCGFPSGRSMMLRSSSVRAVVRLRPLLPPGVTQMFCHKKEGVWFVSCSRSCCSFACCRCSFGCWWWLFGVCGCWCWCCCGKHWHDGSIQQRKREEGNWENLKLIALFESGCLMFSPKWLCC